MKAIIFVLCLTLVAVQGGDEMFKEYMAACIKETDPDQNILQQVLEGDITAANEKISCFTTCMLQKFKIINDNGDVDADAMSDAISMVIDNDDDINRIVNACKDVAPDDCGRGLNLLKCCWDNKVPVMK